MQNRRSAVQCWPGESRTHDQSIMSRPPLSGVLTSVSDGHASETPTVICSVRSAVSRAAGLRRVSMVLSWHRPTVWPRRVLGCRRQGHPSRLETWAGQVSGMAYGVCMPELLWPTPPLADDIVLLRPWCAADVPENLMATREPVVQRFSWPRTTPYTEKDALTFFVEQEQARVRGEALNLACTEPSDRGVVLGGGSLYDVDLQQGRAAIGYWLAPEARGRGVATHTVRLVARWAFEELQVARLELMCAPENRASQRVAERCGFTREGTAAVAHAVQGRAT